MHFHAKHGFFPLAFPTLSQTRSYWAGCVCWGPTEEGRGESACRGALPVCRSAIVRNHWHSSTRCMRIFWFHNWSDSPVIRWVTCDVLMVLPILGEVTGAGLTSHDMLNSEKRFDERRGRQVSKKEGGEENKTSVQPRLVRRHTLEGVGVHYSWDENTAQHAHHRKHPWQTVAARSTPICVSTTKLPRQPIYPGISRLCRDLA